MGSSDGESEKFVPAKLTDEERKKYEAALDAKREELINLHTAKKYGTYAGKATKVASEARSDVWDTLVDGFLEKEKLVRGRNFRLFCEGDGVGI
jgi:hypothetical protein